MAVLRSAYKRFERFRETASVNTDPESRAVQADKEDSDINTIVRRFGITGMVQMPERLPTYGDFDGISDYRTALHVIREADDMFDALPAEVRLKFGNDPAEFVEFASDPENLGELRKMGLAPTPAPAIIPPEPGVPAKG